MEPLKKENLIISQNKIYQNNPIKSQNIFLFPSYQDINSSSFNDENSENEENEILNFEEKNDYSLEKNFEKIKTMITKRKTITKNLILKKIKIKI